MAASAYVTLSTRICPWLRAPLRQFDAAHRDGRLGHGWLLAGPQGAGKINLALVAARRLLEGTDGAVELLSAAEAATAMAERHEPADHHPDLHWLFPESNRRTLTIEQIRGASQALSLTSHAGRAKVLVIEPADAMTAAAANALLKTLEEPSAETYLLLISHQPGRLPATIRSRCQSLPVTCPPTEETAAWLKSADAEIEATNWTAALDLAQGLPFRAIAIRGSSFYIENNKLTKEFHLISRNKLDPQSVADDWVKGDTELALGWLTVRLQSVIRARMAQRTGTNTTSGAGDLLEAWRPLTTRFLFQQLQNAELLLSQVGGGINLDLAIRALLLGFQPRRDRP